MHAECMLNACHVPGVQLCGAALPGRMAAGFTEEGCHLLMGIYKKHEQLSIPSCSGRQAMDPGTGGKPVPLFCCRNNAHLDAV